MNSHRSSSRTQARPMLRLVSSSGPTEPARAQEHHARSLRRYGLASVLLYNGLTLAHYVLGALVLLVAYRQDPYLGWPLALAYLVFAFAQFYVLMPLCICPGCVYRGIPGGRCIAGLNVVSQKVRPSAGAIDEFEQRARGVLCHNTLYAVALLAPLVLVIPGLVLAFSWLTVGLAALVLVLVAVRVEVVFRHLGCPHCLARRWCPNARAMRVV